MRWPPTADDKADLIAVASVFTTVMAGAAYISSLRLLFAILAALGFCVLLATLLLLPSRDASKEQALPSGIKAGHGISAGGSIESAGSIQAGHGVHAGGHIRSRQIATRADPTKQAHLPGLVNPLVGHFRIRQYAAPVRNSEGATVFRVVIAADPQPVVGELDSATKTAFKDALAQSSLERWGHQTIDNKTTDAPTGWMRAQPSLGTVATFEREWGIASRGASVLCGRATVALPPGFQFGSRAVLVLDVVERQSGSKEEQPRLSLSLAGLHAFLHVLGRAAADEIGNVVFPLLCGERRPTLVGPNYEISFGDRSLETTLAFPPRFERPADAVSNPWAEINTPEDFDARDPTARDSVIRRGLETMLRSNEYDEIEDAIAELQAPEVNRIIGSGPFRRRRRPRW